MFYINIVCIYYLKIANHVQADFQSVSNSTHNSVAFWGVCFYFELSGQKDNNHCQDYKFGQCNAHGRHHGNTGDKEEPQNQRSQVRSG